MPVLTMRLTLARGMVTDNPVSDESREKKLSMPDQDSRTHPRSGRAPAAYVEVDSGDRKRLILQGTRGVDFEPCGCVLRGQGVLESAIA